MITIATLMWVFSGIFSFFMNLGHIINVVEVLFADSTVVIKSIWLAGAFVVHVVGGLISLAIAIYSKLKG